MNRHALRTALTRRDRTLKIIGAHDALSARVGEHCGFDAIWASGFGISATHCVPDANILTMTECLTECAAIVRAVRLPVIADCDSGYGDLPNVARMVEDYERQGVAAVCIEDKVFPKLNSFAVNAGLQRLVPAAHFQAKIRVACAARRSADFLVIARTEALVAGASLDEALERAEAYESAGADALLIHSKATTPAEIEAFCARYRGRCPLIAVPTMYPAFSCDAARRAGVSALIFANQGIRGCVTALRRVFKQIHDDGHTQGVEAELAAIGDIFDLQDMHALESLYVEHGAEQAGAHAPKTAPR